MGILREKFAHLNLVYSIGGQISFDVFPEVTRSPVQVPFMKGMCRNTGDHGCGPYCKYYIADALHCLTLASDVLTGLGQDLLPALCGRGVLRHPLLWRQDFRGAARFMCFCQVSQSCHDVHTSLEHGEDMTVMNYAQGGNDYEIFMSEKTKGHTVTSPVDTVQQCTELFIKPAKEALQC